MVVLSRVDVALALARRPLFPVLWRPRGGDNVRVDVPVFFSSSSLSVLAGAVEQKRTGVAAGSLPANGKSQI